MSKTDDYRAKLRALPETEWDQFLQDQSGLPGPRGNLELVQAVADEGNEALFLRYLTIGPDAAPTNTPLEFLPVCGTVGLGRLAAEGNDAVLPILRTYANDPRWRTREGVAMALQRLGDADMPRLLAEMIEWSKGSLLEQRAAAAALCEPRLLRTREAAVATLRILDEITASLAAYPVAPDKAANAAETSAGAVATGSRESGTRKSDAFQTLRQALAYCWSVAAAADPEDGKPFMEKWFASADKDVQWIMRENLKKNRLVKMDSAWVEKWQAELTPKH